MGERRRQPRHKSFLRGCVYFNNRRAAFDCVIRDLSAVGARITFSDTVSVPDIIDFYIPQKEKTVRAHVQWRHGDEIGLAFEEPLRDETPKLPGDDLAQRVAQLEDEIASLRRDLKRLKREVAAGDDVDAA